MILHITQRLIHFQMITDKLRKEGKIQEINRSSMTWSEEGSVHRCRTVACEEDLNALRGLAPDKIIVHNFDDVIWSYGVHRLLSVRGGFRCPIEEA